MPYFSSKTARHWVRLTRTCNNHCLFCLDKDAQDGSLLTFEEIKKDLLCGLRQEAARAILSGGEPTLHPEFLAVIALARKLGYREIQVITNGRMFMYRDFLEAGVRAGVTEVTFSLHGHNSELHDAQTQVSGSFQQSLCGLRNALDIDQLIVNVDIVINKINVRRLRQIIRFFVRLGVREFDLLQVIPFGLAWDNRKALLYEVEQEIGWLRRAFLLSRDKRLKLWTNRFPPRYLEGFEGLIQSPLKLYDEVKGNRKILADFLLRGIRRQCAGLRCQHCFLEGFCQDLAALRKDKILLARKMPACLRTRKAIQGDQAGASFVLKERQDILFDFLAFYIGHRYFIKGLRCVKCRRENVCAGAPLEYIRSNGFKRLNPIIHAGR